jgi:hypothetical protein
MIRFAGIPGTDFSTNLNGPHALVEVVTVTATTITVQARSEFLSGASIATTVPAGANLSWGAATLSGGGVHALAPVEMPGGDAAKALTSLAGFVLVSVGNTNKFYFIRPGEVTIDSLDFASKESNPDDIEDMLTFGDKAAICGGGSLETWYATGDDLAPFAPTAGLAYARGVVEGTPVVVKEVVILVGNDGVVYAIGSGVQRISDHGIEERIRTQLRREQGLN